MDYPSLVPLGCRRVSLMKRCSVAALLLFFTCAAPAQITPEQGLLQLINAFQTGTVDLRAFAPPAQQMILDQTGGTLRYEQLSQLGPPQSVTFLGSQQLPHAVVHRYRVGFAATVLHWEVVVGPDNLIQTFSFRDMRTAQRSRPADTLPRPLPPPPPPSPPRAVTGGGGMGAPSPVTSPATAERPFAQVRVFYATDRNQTQSTQPGQRYGSDRSPVISFGEATVSIPLDHRKGYLESPSILKFWRLNFSEDPEKNIVLLSVTPVHVNRYFQELRRITAEPRFSNAFIFIHGYNVTFKEAARRTAQMQYDLEFPGVPIFYSWPSNGNTPAYTRDEENVNWSAPNVKQFLHLFATQTQIQRIYLIAHSMGNRALAGAFTTLMAEQPQLRSRFKEIILAAPDIDAQVFARDIAPRLIGSGDATTPVTLYASSSDRALAASKVVHGHRRAGDTTGGPILVPGLVYIDATAVDTSFMGHAYFAGIRSVIADIHGLIRGQPSCDRFGLSLIPTSTGKACVIVP